MGRVVPRHDREQTNTQTDTLIIIRRFPIVGGVISAHHHFNEHSMFSTTSVGQTGNPETVRLGGGSRNFLW